MVNFSLYYKEANPPL